MNSGLRSALGWSILLNAFRLLLSFLSIKVTAVILGPSGVALVGQAANFLSLLKDAPGNAIVTSVVKMTAESGRDGGERMLQLWGTALRLAATLGVIVGLVVVVASVPLSLWLFGRDDLWPVVVLMGLMLPLSLVGWVLAGILAGQKKFNLTTITDIGAATIGAILFIGFTYRFGLFGSLVGVTLATGAGLLVVLIVFASREKVKITDIVCGWRRDILPSIIVFYPMLLVHTASENIAPLFKRQMLIDAVGIGQAGLWQATLRVSDMYIMVIFTALGLYVMPTLAAIKEPTEFRAKMFRLVLYAGAMTAAVALVIYLCRDLIVHLVFTQEFLPMRDLIGYQLLGDIFRVAGFPLRSALMIQLRVKTYMGMEAGIGLMQVALTYGLLPHLGLQTATVVHAAAWGIALLALLLLHSHVRRDTKQTA